MDTRDKDNLSCPGASFCDCDRIYNRLRWGRSRILTPGRKFHPDSHSRVDSPAPAVRQERFLPGSVNREAMDESEGWTDDSPSTPHGQSIPARPGRVHRLSDPGGGSRRI